MPLDTFTCGTCRNTFTDLNEFVIHKQSNCSSRESSHPGLGPGTEVLQLHLNKSGMITGLTAESLAAGDNGATLAFLNDVGLDGSLRRSDLEEGQQGEDTATTTHLIILNNGGIESSVDTADGGVTLLDSTGHAGGLSGVAVISQAGEHLTMNMLASAEAETTGVSDRQGLATESLGGVEQGHDSGMPLKKKRAGRSKTGEGKIKVLEAVPPTTPKPAVPETNADGKLVCPMCKRTFTKERHFNTHKCLASSSYVDITKREIVKIDSGDEDEVLDLDAGAQDDGEDEFTAPVDDALDVEREEEDDEKEMDKEEIMDDEKDGKKKRRGRKRKHSSLKFHVDVHNENTGARQMKAAAENMENLPIFRSDDDKTEFEACIDVDLSQQVDHMFRIHIIEQELNELSGMVYNTPTMSSLSVYSCNVCEKVFKSLSHIRLHCVTHTDLKPFKCNKCTYSTNSKGNLYTHMRKHTGQFYRCDQCDFKTVNKSHLVEHHMTHDNRRSQCLLCQKDYSTLKSLINHIRKYHTDDKGRDYLQTFLQGRGVKGTTVIHQCHVCNRKFKKRIDRDRHLFIHDIKDLPHVQQCELCDYWASRRVYLDKHYLKHRVIYCCAVCNDKFLSTTRLTEHLTSFHTSENEAGMSVADSLLEECINRSLYLPEPLAATLEGSRYINLPEELREKTAQSQESAEQFDMPVQPTHIGNDLTTHNPVPSQDSLAPSQNSPVPSQNSPVPSQNSPDMALEEPASDFLSEYRRFIKTPNGNEGAGLNPEEGTVDSASVEESMDIHLATRDTVMHEGLMMTEDSESQQWKESAAKCVQEISDTLKNQGQCQADMIKSEIVATDDRIRLSTASPLLMLQNPGSNSDMEEDGLIPDEKESMQNIPDSHPATSVDDEESADAGNDYEEKKETITVSSGEIGHDELDKERDDNDSSDVNKSKSKDMKIGATKEEKIESLIHRLGYRKMSMQIFNKMRETFGTEECEYCGRLFYSKGDYEPHLRTHTGDKPFACANCSFRGTTKDQLKKHSEREHDKVAFQCKECDFLAPTRTRLWNHQLKHLGINGLSCPKCPHKFDGMKQLRAHILNVHQDVDKDTLEKLTGYRHKPLGKMGRRSFKCPHCPRVFIRANSELQKHIWIHEGIRPFACPLCSYACRSKNNLQAHMLRHSTEKPFSCSECGKEYKSKTALRWHVRSHKTGKLFKCDKCSYEATQSSHLKRHMETHDVLKRFICKHCDFSANTLGYIKIHYAKHHKGKAFDHGEVIDASNTPPEKKVYKCLSCGYLFGNLSDLKRHLKIRHHVHMQDIVGMEQMQISEVEVVQYDEEMPSATASTIPSHSLQSEGQVDSGEMQLQMSNEEGNVSLSAVNLIKQLIGMSQGDGQVSVVSEDGEPLNISQETIIVHQDGQLLLTSDAGGILPGSQYIIQYYSPGDVQPDGAILNDGQNMEIQLTSADTQEQTELINSEGADESSQFIITANGQMQLLTSDGHAQILTHNGQAQVIAPGESEQLITIDSEGQILNSECVGGQFITSSLENYSNQLIVADPSNPVQGLVIKEETIKEEQGQLSAIEVQAGGDNYSK